MNKNNWRKLDNMAKIFSLADKKKNNIFRYTAILKYDIDEKKLKEAVDKSINNYLVFKVKKGTGIFWNYLVKNEKEIIIKKEIPSNIINFDKNNNYLFKVIYNKNQINLEMYHLLTDGLGAKLFFQDILNNYISLKYNIKIVQNKIIKLNNNDEYLNNSNKKLKCEKENKNAFIIQDKNNLLNNKTYYYILNLERLKNICKKKRVSITEYITSIYIYTIYKTLYDPSSKKDIMINIPIDLRKYYNVETLFNFFTCTSIEGKVINKKDLSFDYILDVVHTQFKNKITKENIDKYLYRDVKLGTNLGIRLVPLFFKKKIMKYLGHLVSKSTTTTLSNVGKIELDEIVKKYITNVMVTVNAGEIQKIKCTICSYENKLTITINSNLIDKSFENEFYKNLKKYIGFVKIESNNV